jgi:hypothetical protein
MDSVSLDLKFLDFIQFLERYSSSDMELQMICPVYGIPLPYIIIESRSSTALSVKVEFSLKSSKDLIRYVLRAREPPH